MDPVVNTNHDDEIDLFDLIDHIREKWYWLIGCILVSFVLAFSYVSTVTPVYQTEIIFRPALDEGLLEFKQPLLESVFSLSGEGAYQQVKNIAQSATAKRDFYLSLVGQKKYQAELFSSELTQEQNIAEFAKHFVFSGPGKNEDGQEYARVTLQMGGAQLATDILNQYGQFIIASYQLQVKAKLEALIQSQLKRWQFEAESLEAEYLDTVNHRYQLLQEAAIIAESINQRLPLYSNGDVLVSSAPPLYMMGEKASRMEMAQLEKRLTAEAAVKFLPQLAKLNRHITTLKQTSINWQKVRLVQWDKQAILPRNPLKPRKLQILILSIIVGAMFGVMAALVAYGKQRWNERRRRRATAKARKTSY